MDYRKHYTKLIERAQNRNLDGYCEVHHIVPRCVGGDDSVENLVKLTPEEHYVAHQLLVKIYKNNIKLIRAAVMMIPNRPSNKLYGWLKREYSKIQSESQSGTGNTQYGTRWVHSNELKISKKIKKDELTPIGWEDGRKIKFDRVSKSEINKQNQIIKDDEIKNNTIIHFKKYLESDYESLNEYCKNEYEYSLVIFTKRLKKYIPEYSLISKQGARNIKERLKGVKL